MAYGYSRSTFKKDARFNPEDNYRVYPRSSISIPIIRRKFWFGLRPDAAHLREMTEPHKKICFVSAESVECTKTDHCLMEMAELQKRNMLFRGWPDIPFNFVITGDGNIYEGRGWLMKYHNFGKESMQEALQIAYLGYYKDKDPPQEMVDLGGLLIEYGKQRGFISEDYSYMECPLDEYYQYPTGGVEAYIKSPGYQEFLATIPPPPPPRPPKPPCPGNQTVPRE